MVRLLDRCTVIKSQWVLVTPAGSLWVLSTWAMTEGGDDEAKPPYSVTHPEVAPAVLVVIREDISDRRLILGPDDGGVLPLRVPVPQPFVQHGPYGVALGSPEHHTVWRQAMRARMQDAREMSHGASP